MCAQAWWQVRLVRTRSLYELEKRLKMMCVKIQVFWIIELPMCMAGSSLQLARTGLYTNKLATPWSFTSRKHNKPPSPAPDQLLVCQRKWETLGNMWERFENGIRVGRGQRQWDTCWSIGKFQNEITCLRTQMGYMLVMEEDSKWDTRGGATKKLRMG